MDTRRSFLRRSIAFSAGFAGMNLLMERSGHSIARALTLNTTPGYGDLVNDADKILDLPAGFSYKVISRSGSKMADGLFVPGLPDGMATFQGKNGLTTIVRNHEINPEWNKHSPFGTDNSLLALIDKSKVYDLGHGKRPSLGGCTTLVFDTRTQSVQREFLSLAGTNHNCAGGPTPWGSWLSCEEQEDLSGPDAGEKDHGYVFEVPAREDSGLVAPVPIKLMGRFMHEAVAVDPRTGIVYMSEDKPDGLIYRYIPEKREVLLAGGKLQALVIADRTSCDTSNHEGVESIARGAKLATKWIDLDDIQSPKNDLRYRGFASGAAKFARGEGMWWGGDCFYYAATIGGRNQKGQIWKYTPGEYEGTTDEKPGTIELFVEPNDGRVVENADNLTVSPWGDLFVCEDGPDTKEAPSNRLLRVSPTGDVSTFAHNAKSDSEFAGVCFSPDGSTMFVNIQGDGLTLAINGPWRS